MKKANKKLFLKKKPFANFLFIAFFLIYAIAFISCSSAPKRPTQITTTYNLGINQLDSANVESERGNYKLAENLLDEAWRLAVSIDSVELRVLTKLSQGNLAFYQNNQEVATKMWQEAFEEAEDAHNDELSALSKIYQTRGILSWGNPDNNINSPAANLKNQNSKENALLVIQIVSSEMANLKKSNQLYTAYAWMLLGFAKKQLGQWQQAVEHFKTSEKIHEDMLYLELAAYDWFAIASVHSVADNYEQAVNSINKAIEFDRRAENTYGLANDYLALSEIYKKSGQIELSQKALKRSKEIFASSSLLNTSD